MRSTRYGAGELLHRQFDTGALASEDVPACQCQLCRALPDFTDFEPQYGLNAVERGEAGPNGKPSYTIDEAAAQLTRNNTTWNGAGVLGQSATVTYAFRDTAPATMPGGTVGFTPFTAAQIVQAERSLQSWADVANIVFRRVGTGTGADAYSEDAQMLFAAYQSGGAGAAFAYGPGGGNASVGGDSWYRVEYVEGAANLNYNRQVLTHEIGHAIGISHPGSYNAGNGSPTYATDAVYYEDSRQYSVMSYWSASNTGANLGGRHSAAPLLDDIAAAQRLYGANMTTRTGDTVYGFNSNTGRDFYTTAGPGTPLIFAAWDAGGTDTFDFSGYTQAQRIDLRAGNFSDVGGLIGNVAIAAGVVIENALGGAGADVITGNAAANRLTGGGGRDRLTGGAGADTFVVAAVAHSAPGAATRDVVTDFTVGQDRLDLLLAGGLRFIGGTLLSGIAGEVRAAVAAGLTIIELDRDGDRAVDLEIELIGALMLTGPSSSG